MNKTTWALALFAAVALSACNRPAVVAVPASPAAAPAGPAGPAGPTGATGATGATGEQGTTGTAGSGTTVNVMPPASMPPEMPASAPAN